MRILITNDDGIHAEGIRELARVASRHGQVKVVAPDRERSACGHSMTMREPLRIRQVEFGGLEAYEVNGVPVDCVNIGLTVCWPDGCDLILSGINHGPNLGYDVTYSGTVGGAMEGAINGIRSIALSMAPLKWNSSMFVETGGQWLDEHWQSLVQAPLRRATFLNVNIPARPYSELKGVKAVQMGERVYQDRVEERDDPWGARYFWQGGVIVMDTRRENTDVWAVAQGFVSVTPILMDWTDHGAMSELMAAINKS